MTKYLDARTDAVGTELNGEICIVGAGAAGLSLARKLAKTTSGVLLIEAGSFNLEGRTQALFSGQQLGLAYHNLTSCRLRQWGGTTNHWSGYCRANDLVDYEGRPDLNLPRWPFGHAELAPYIAEAGHDLRLGSEDHFDAAKALQSLGIDASQLPDARSEVLQTKVFQFAKNTRLGPAYRDEIEASANVIPVLNLNLCHIQLSTDGTQVLHLDCATLTGKKVRVTAKVFVLCCHAIENARLLLASNRLLKKSGLDAVSRT